MINKSDNKAEYTFKKVQKYTYLKSLFIFQVANTLEFKMSVVIDIYPFKWEFKCI